ncbi:MAG: DUF305 domain-containing protein [Acidobacteria bacterium]|nr:DUF305 domain-containing protein [Acidobacteriota bacterium]
MPILHFRLIFAGFTLAAATACASSQPTSRVPDTAQTSAPPVVQPGAPGEASRIVSAESTAKGGALPFTDADVKFMQGMIGHHAQALEMTALLYDRSSNPDMKLLAKRIEVSQLDEIQMMKGWLTGRRQSLPDEHAHHAGDHALMPGMLTLAQMQELTAAKGVDFDRLFLQGMIRHHGGALTMVQELFSKPGAGQDGEIFAFASDVDADQRMEMDRMGAMLALLKEYER